MSPGDIANIEVALVLEAIEARYGCDLRGYARASIARRLLDACDRLGLACLSDLQHRLLRDPDFFAQLLTHLTVQVTDMYRDPDFFRAFRERVVPILRTYPLLRIWHAGCATGEEAYATAIMLSEEGIYDRTQIYATDLSAHAIAHAKQGVYDVSRLPTYVQNHARAGGTCSLLRHLTQGYDRVIVRDALKRNILFFQHNLTVDHSFGEMHVVFCRNVLIYLSPALRATVLSRLAGSLADGGFLCLGKSEHLGSDTQRCFTPFLGGEAIYRHTGVARRTV